MVIPDAGSQRASCMATLLYCDCGTCGPAGGSPIAPPTSGGILDSLKKADEQQNQAPAGPQVPRSQ